MTAAPCGPISHRVARSRLPRWTRRGKRRVSPDPAFLSIQGGELYTPRAAGPGSVLIACRRIVQVGEARPEFAADVLDATGCIVTPRLIDPHEHLIGGSGESGFHTQTPEIFLQELIEGAITTVVGCLGVDVVTRTMLALLAKVKGLRRQGI